MSTATSMCKLYDASTTYCYSTNITVDREVSLFTGLEYEMNSGL